jgi:8-oxo-dGTP diphosphatase
MPIRRPYRQFPRVAAYGLVLREEKILLCRLSQRVPNIAGHWTLPGGGIEFGEDPMDAVAREVREETGLIVRACGLAGVHSFTSENRERKFHSIRIIYRTEILSGDLCFEAEGSTDCCGWWSQDEARVLPLLNLGELGLNLAFGNQTTGS